MKTLKIEKWSEEWGWVKVATAADETSAELWLAFNGKVTEIYRVV